MSTTIHGDLLEDVPPLAPSVSEDREWVDLKLSEPDLRELVGNIAESLIGSAQDLILIRHMPKLSAVRRDALDRVLARSNLAEVLTLRMAPADVDALVCALTATFAVTDRG